MVDLVEVVDAAGVTRVAALAQSIWRQHYTPIIGAAQVTYMLERFQSEGAIAAQIGAGRRYVFLEVDTQAIGYLAYDRTGEGCFLSKCYLDAAQRGQGHGRAALGALIARERPRVVTLTVNKHNQSAIGFYRAVGFVITGPQVSDIGGGFVMDDWQMRWECAG